MAERDRFDEIVKRLDSPLAIVTTAVRDERAGCLIGFHCQCSIEPRRYAMWLSKANHTYRVSLFSTSWAIHFLDKADHDLAELFGTNTGDEIDKFARCAWDRGPNGVPLLRRCPTRLLVARVTVLDDGSDHVCVVTTPLEAHVGPPLDVIRLSAVSDLPAGHEVTERPRPGTTRAAD